MSHSIVEPQEIVMAVSIRFGVEEEFFLTDLDSGSVVRRPPPAFHKRAQESLGDSLSHELLQCQVELKTAILQSSTEALDVLTAGRNRLVEIAKSFDMGIVAAGTHPLAQWRSQVPTSEERYEELLDDFQIIAQRNLLCGLHVHAEVRPGLDRIQLMNRVMRWLPLFLALSASSPYWARQDTGLMSYRQAAYDEWPRTGIPRLFENEQEYQRYVGTLIRVRAIADESYIWWALRPSSRYPTIELRITDVCPRVIDTACIAELFRTVVLQESLVADGGDVMNVRDGIERLLIEENRWRAKRFGVRAKWLDAESGSNIEMSECLMQLSRHCEAAVGELGADWAFDHARRIIEEGSSAERQRRMFSAARTEGLTTSRAFRRVVNALTAETAG
ncbi:MAG: carboxylate-amine ligase [Steroidobacteraceae bacterium]